MYMMLLPPKKIPGGGGGGGGGGEEETRLATISANFWTGNILFFGRPNSVRGRVGAGPAAPFLWVNTPGLITWPGNFRGPDGGTLSIV